LRSNWWRFSGWPTWPLYRLVHLYGLNAGGPQTQSGFGYYPIDNRRVIAIELDNRQTNDPRVGLMMLEVVQAD
jgi:hypothetical protein